MSSAWPKAQTRTLASTPQEMTTPSPALALRPGLRRSRRPGARAAPGRRALDGEEQIGIRQKRSCCSLLARLSTFRGSARPTRIEAAARQRRGADVSTYIARRDGDRRRLGHARGALSWRQTTLTEAPPRNVFVAQRRNALQLHHANDAPRRADQPDVSISLSPDAARHGPRPAARGALGPRGPLTEPGRRNTASRRVSGAH